MATARYFMTEEQLKAKNWDMLQEAKSLKGRRAALENEWKRFSSAWRVLGHTSIDSMSLRVDDKSLTVLNPSQSMVVVDTIPWPQLDIEAAKRLCIDLEETRVSLMELERQLRDLGVSLA